VLKLAQLFNGLPIRTLRPQKLLDFPDDLRVDAEHLRVRGGEGSKMQSMSEIQEMRDGIDRSRSTLLQLAALAVLDRGII
jgi:hypothetical protein